MPPSTHASDKRAALAVTSRPERGPRAVRSRPRRAARLGRFLRSEPFVAACLAFFVLLALCALIPGLIAPGDPNQGVLREVRQAPAWRHPFGTDALGRDVLSRVIHGTGITLTVGILSTLLG